jgi:hypothetical protein
MSEPDYSPAQALKLILSKLDEADRNLAVLVRTAISEGKDIEETEPATDRRKADRKYRKVMPYSDEEAVQAALGVLRSTLLELPHLVADSLSEFAHAGIDESPVLKQEGAVKAVRKRTRKKSPSNIDEPKTVVIDLTPETQLEELEDEAFTLSAPDESEMNELDERFQELSKLLTFPTDNGDSK